jgi:hypothetical protein
MILPRDFQELLSAFNAHGAKYLVVGGYAVGVHSEPRATKDIDVWIKPDDINSQAVFRALAAFGAPLAGFTAKDFNDSAQSIFQMGQPPSRIDIMQAIDGVSFNDAWESRIDTVIDNIPTHVISSEMLIRNKLATGRPRDLLDVEDIREATGKASAPKSL